jgi:hypothetical protein
LNFAPVPFHSPDYFLINLHVENVIHHRIFSLLIQEVASFFGESLCTCKRFSNVIQIEAASWKGVPTPLVTALSSFGFDVGGLSKMLDCVLRRHFLARLTKLKRTNEADNNFACKTFAYGTKSDLTVEFK